MYKETLLYSSHLIAKKFAINKEYLFNLDLTL